MQALLIFALILSSSFNLSCVTSSESESEVTRQNVLRPQLGDGSVVIMRFEEPINLNPIGPGWQHKTFLRSEPMIITFEEKLGIDAIRLDTRDMSSMLVRQVEVPLIDYPILSWRWLIEKGIESKVDETTREGDDHPAIIYITFQSNSGGKRMLELVWGNRVKKDTVYRIDGMPKYVVRNNGDGFGVWHSEKLKLADVYESVFEESSAGTNVVEVAVMADSDSLDLTTSAYFADLTMSSN